MVKTPRKPSQLVGTKEKFKEVNDFICGVQRRNELAGDVLTNIVKGAPRDFSLHLQKTYCLTNEYSDYYPEKYNDDIKHNENDGITKSKSFFSAGKPVKSSHERAGNLATTLWLNEIPGSFQKFCASKELSQGAAAAPAPPAHLGGALRPAAAPLPDRPNRGPHSLRPRTAVDVASSMALPGDNQSTSSASKGEAARFVPAPWGATRRRTVAAQQRTGTLSTLTALTAGGGGGGGGGGRRGLTCKTLDGLGGGDGGGDGGGGRFHSPLRAAAGATDGACWSPSSPRNLSMETSRRTASCDSDNTGAAGELLDDLQSYDAASYVTQMPGSYRRSPPFHRRGFGTRNLARRLAPILGAPPDTLLDDDSAISLPTCFAGGGRATGGAATWHPGLACTGEEEEEEVMPLPLARTAPPLAHSASLPAEHPLRSPVFQRPASPSRNPGSGQGGLVTKSNSLDRLSTERAPRQRGKKADKPQLRKSQEFFLAAVFLQKYAVLTWAKEQRCRKTIDAMKAASQAASTIQKTWRTKRAAVQFRALQVVRLTLKRRLINLRRRVAANRLRAFLTDRVTLGRWHYLSMFIRYRVRKIQRLVRCFLVTGQERVNLLSLAWDLRVAELLRRQEACEEERRQLSKRLGRVKANQLTAAKMARVVVDLSVSERKAVLKKFVKKERISFKEFTMSKDNLYSQNRNLRVSVAGRLMTGQTDPTVALNLIPANDYHVLLLLTERGARERFAKKVDGLVLRPAKEARPGGASSSNSGGVKKTKSAKTLLGIATARRAVARMSSTTEFSDGTTFSLKSPQGGQRSSRLGTSCQEEWGPFGESGRSPLPSAAVEEEEGEGGDDGGGGGSGGGGGGGSPVDEELEEMGFSQAHWSGLARSLGKQT